MSYHDLDIASLTYKSETQLVAAYDRIPFRLDIWGAWASSSILKLDATSTVFPSDRRPPYVEYQTLNTGSSDLLIEGTLAYRLADQAIHTNLLDLYFNRMLVDIGFRGAYFQDGFSRLLLRPPFPRPRGGPGLAWYARARGCFGEAYARLDGSSFNEAIGFRLGLQLVALDRGTPLRPASFRRQIAGDLE